MDRQSKTFPIERIDVGFFKETEASQQALGWSTDRTRRSLAVRGLWVFTFLSLLCFSPPLQQSETSRTGLTTTCHRANV